MMLVALNAVVRVKKADLQVRFFFLVSFFVIINLNKI